MPKKQIQRICEVCGVQFLCAPHQGYVCSNKCVSRKAQESYCVERVMTADQSDRYLELAIELEAASGYLRQAIKQQMAEVSAQAKPLRTYRND